MKEELAEKTQVAMVEMIESIVKAKDFAVDQAPEVVSQLLNYNMAVWFAWTALWSVFLVVSVWGLYKFIVLVEDDDDYVPGVALTVCTTAFFITCVWSTVFDGWLKIWLAPKVWLLEYAANLVG